MSDVPQMPGGENPFNFDFSQFMQNFDMSEFMRMLQSPGPVNMEIARATARGTATLDAETGEAKPEPPVDPAAVSAFDGIVRAAQLAVADATGISGAMSIPTRCVDRAEWSQTTLDGLAPVFASLASALGNSEGIAQHPAQAGNDALFAMVMQSLVPMLLGSWAGSMIGLLSHRALGQYDLPLPLTGTPVQLFVVRNVDDFASEWELPIEELRYALALREVVHGAQRAVPWVRERLVSLASEYVAAYEVRAEAFDIDFTDINPADPASMAAFEQFSDPGALLGAMQSERQVPMLAELQRFASVLEGYTDVVVASVGERMIGSHGRVDEALRRHRLERGDANGFVDRLLGLELERAHYEQGAAFCSGVVERAGLDGLNRLWSDAAMSPTPAEFNAPGLWLARIDL